MFSEKQKILTIVLTLIGMNALGFMLLVVWPNDKQAEDAVQLETASVNGQEKTRPFDVDIDVEGSSTSTSISTSKEIATVSSLPVDAGLVEEDKHTIESDVREVDTVVVPVYTKGSVLEAMEQYQASSDTFSFSGKNFPGIGMFVEEVQGVRESGGRYWILYINGVTSDVGVSRTRVMPGDHVEWRYEENIY